MITNYYYEVKAPKFYAKGIVRAHCIGEAINFLFQQINYFINDISIREMTWDEVVDNDLDILAESYLGVYSYDKIVEG